MNVQGNNITTGQSNICKVKMAYIEELKIEDEKISDASQGASTPNDNNQTNSTQSSTQILTPAVSPPMGTSWECISHALSEVLEGSTGTDCAINSEDTNCKSQPREDKDSETLQNVINDSHNSVVIRPPREKRDCGTRALYSGYNGNGIKDSTPHTTNIEGDGDVVGSNVALKSLEVLNNPYGFALDACSPPPGIIPSTLINKHRSLASTLPLILEGDTLNNVRVTTQPPAELRDPKGTRYSLTLAESSMRKLNGLIDQSNLVNNTHRHSIASINELNTAKTRESAPGELLLSEDLDSNLYQLNVNRRYRQAAAPFGQQQRCHTIPSMQVNHLMRLLNEKLCNLDECSSSIDKKLDLYEYHCRKKLEDSREQLRKRIDELVEICGRQINETVSGRRQRLQILERDIENHLTATQSILAQAKMNLVRPEMSSDDLHNINNILLDCLVRTKKFQRQSNEFNYWLDFVPKDPLDSDDCIGFLRFTEVANVSPRSEITPASEIKKIVLHNTGQQQQMNSENPLYSSMMDTFTALQPHPQCAYSVTSSNRYSLPQDIQSQFSNTVDPAQLIQSPVANQNNFYRGERPVVGHSFNGDPVNSDVLLRRPAINSQSASVDGSSRIYLNRRNSWHPMLNSSQPFSMTTYAAVKLNEPNPTNPTYPPVALSAMPPTTPVTQQTQHNANNISSYQSANHISWVNGNTTMVMGQPILVPAADFLNSSTQILSQPSSAVLTTQIPSFTRGCMQFQPAAILPPFQQQTLAFNPSQVQQKIGVQLDDCSNVAGRSFRITFLAIFEDAAINFCLIVIHRKFRKPPTCGLNRMSIAGYAPSSLMTLDIHHPIILDCYGDRPKHLKCIKGLCFMSYNRLLVCENGRRSGHKNVLIFTLSGNFIRPLNSAECSFVNPTGLCVMQNSAFSTPSLHSSVCRTELDKSSDSANGQTVIVADGSVLKTFDPHTNQVIATFEMDQQSSGDLRLSTDLATPHAEISGLVGGRISEGGIPTLAPPAIYHRQDRYGGLCAVDNVIYICDRKLPCVKVFDIRSSSIVASWSNEDIVNPNFAYRKNNYVYVSDSASNKVLKLDASDGRRLGELSATPPGGGKNLFNNPSGICDDGEQLAVADLYNNRIQLFVKDSLIGSIYSPCIESPFSIAYHPMGVAAISNGRPRTVTLYFTMLS